MSESLLNWDDYLQVASLSDVGMRRSNNQDNLCVSMASSMEQWQRKGHLLVVADGMGAHAAGELASKLAIDHIPHLYAKYNDDPPPTALRKAVEDANSEIHRRGQANEEFHNMGTTCSTFCLLPQGAVVAHIGDSRVYRYSQNRIEQLTFDHSLVWEMKAAGQLTDAEEKQGKVPKNVITRSLGPYPECKVDLEGPFPVQVGDTFLLCSDGLTGVITDDEIGSLLANMPPQEAAKVLVDLANLRGGPDNITVVIMKVMHPQLATASPHASATTQKSNAVGAPAWVWVGLAVSVIMAVILFFAINIFASAIPAAAAVVFLLIGIIKSLGGSSAPAVSNRPLGKGPYVRRTCPTGEKFGKQLGKMIKKVKDGAQKEGWKVNWDQLDRLVAGAGELADKKDHAGAIRTYGRAVSLMMDQLRSQETDSSIDL
jgi:protein phosphatase